MADIEARREARRRKILENSERRLKKISGVEERNSRSELDGINLNTSYVVESESILGTNSTSDNSEGEDNHQLQDNGPYDSLELQTIFYNPRSVANESVSNCYVEVTEDKGYSVILIMPIVLSLILVFFDIYEFDTRSYYLNKIFVPLILYEIVAYFLGRSVHNTSNFLNSLVLLTSSRNQFLVNYVGYFQSLLNIMQDIMIYFFVFSLSYWFLRIIIPSIIL